MGISVTVLIPLFSFPFPGALHVWPGTCSCLLRPISAVTASAESFDNRLPRHPLHVRRGPALSVPFLLLSAETDFPGKPPYPQAVCLPRRPFSDPGTRLRLPGDTGRLLHYTLHAVLFQIFSHFGDILAYRRRIIRRPKKNFSFTLDSYIVIRYNDHTLYRATIYRTAMEVKSWQKTMR